MAVKNISDLQIELASDITDNTAKLNTAARVRNIIGDFIDSAINRITDKELLNLRVFSSSRSYEVGEATLYDPGTGYQVYRCTTAHSGAWNAGHFSAVNAVVGSAGGDLSGTYPNPTVVKINGVSYNTDPLQQYAILTGRTGGQTLNGSDAASEDLTIASNSTGTKGSIYFDTFGKISDVGQLSIGTLTPLSSALVHFVGAGDTSATSTLYMKNSAGQLVADFQDGRDILFGINGESKASGRTIWGQGAGSGSTDTNATFVGFGALGTGSQLVVVGDLAYAGEYSVMVGSESGRNGAGMSYQVGVGYRSSFNNVGLGGVAVGSQSFLTATAADKYIGLGYRAGYYETASNTLYIHNGLGVSNLATGKTNSIIYGVMNATATSQLLVFNAKVGVGTITPTARIDVIGVGTTTGQTAAFHNSTGSSNSLVILDSGNVGVGTATPATSALVELSSTTGALLLSRMTSTQRDALTAVNGMIIYNSTTNKFQGYENGAWANLI